MTSLRLSLPYRWNAGFPVAGLTSLRTASKSNESRDFIVNLYTF